MDQSADRIEEQILLKAPIACIWRALANAEEFGSWFGVDLQGKSFVPGQRVLGRVTHSGYEHLIWDVLIERVEPERLFSFRWHPGATDPSQDYSQEPTTLVEFNLDNTDDGILLKLSETGFEHIPSSRRAQAYSANSDGWDKQMENILKHVAAQ
jgi:uncharacterized protein YndB with AHSA1/START domain